MRFILVCISVAFMPSVTTAQVKVADSDSLPPLFPLELGSEWRYQIIEVDEEGKAIRKRLGTSQVVGVHIISGKRWFSVFEMGYGFWVRNTAEGLEEADIQLDEDTMQLKATPPRLFFKYPAKENETYAFDPEFDEQKMVVKSVERKVTVPAGEFSCVVYELMEGDKLSSRFYVVPGTGIVKFYQSADLTESGNAEVIEMTGFTRPMANE